MNNEHLRKKRKTEVKKVTEDKNDVIRFLEKLYIGILENNIKVPDECHIEMYSTLDFFIK